MMQLLRCNEFTAVTINRTFFLLQHTIAMHYDLIKQFFLFYRCYDHYLHTALCQMGTNGINLPDTRCGFFRLITELKRFSLQYADSKLQLNGRRCEN